MAIPNPYHSGGHATLSRLPGTRSGGLLGCVVCVDVAQMVVLAPVCTAQNVLTFLAKDFNKGLRLDEQDLIEEAKTKKASTQLDTHSVLTYLISLFSQQVMRSHHSHFRNLKTEAREIHQSNVCRSDS